MRNCAFEAFAWSFHLEAFVGELSLGKFSLALLAWSLSLGVCRCLKSKDPLSEAGESIGQWYRIGRSCFTQLKRSSKKRPGKLIQGKTKYERTVVTISGKVGMDSEPLEVRLRIKTCTHFLYRPFYNIHMLLIALI